MDARRWIIFESDGNIVDQQFVGMSRLWDVTGCTNYLPSVVAVDSFEYAFENDDVKKWVDKCRRHVACYVSESYYLYYGRASHENVVNMSQTCRGS